jgi:hypothetical protein
VPLNFYLKKYLLAKFSKRSKVSFPSGFSYLISGALLFVKYDSLSFTCALIFQGSRPLEMKPSKAP